MLALDDLDALEDPLLHIFAVEASHRLRPSVLLLHLCNLLAYSDILFVHAEVRIDDQQRRGDRPPGEVFHLLSYPLRGESAQLREVAASLLTEGALKRASSRGLQHRDQRLAQQFIDCTREE